MVRDRAVREADICMPCVVCNANSQSQLLMVLACYTCPSGWSREYYGYMMTEAEHSGCGGQRQQCNLCRQLKLFLEVEQISILLRVL